MNEQTPKIDTDHIFHQLKILEELATQQYNAIESEDQEVIADTNLKIMIDLKKLNDTLTNNLRRAGYLPEDTI